MMVQILHYISYSRKVFKDNSLETFPSSQIDTSVIDFRQMDAS